MLDQLTTNKRLYNIILQNYPSMLALRSNSEQKLPVEPAPSKNKPITMAMKLKLKKKKKEEFESKLDMVREKLLQPIPENRPAEISPRSQRPDWISRQFTDHHYLRDIRVHRNSIMHRGAMMNIAKYKLRASSCPDIYKNSMWSMEDQEPKVLIALHLFKLDSYYCHNNCINYVGLSFVCRHGRGAPSMQLTKHSISICSPSSISS